MTNDYSARMFAVVDALDAPGFGEFFTPDAVLVFGNAEPLRGRTAITDGLGGFFGTLKGLTHDVTREWFVDDTHVVESTVTYLRPDDTTVTVPAVSIFHRRGDLIDDYRIFVDLAPLAA